MFKSSFHPFLYKVAAILLVLAFTLGTSGMSVAYAAGKAKTITAVSFSTPAVVGTPVTVTATISPNPSTGTVVFTATWNRKTVALPASCAQVIVSGSTASCTFTPDIQGVYTVTATYSGNTLFAKSTGKANVTALLSTTTVVTDNATTIPGRPAPVTFGGTIVFTATVSSAQGTPNGTVRWTLSHDAYDPYPPSMAELNAGSGIVGACQGDIPVVNGVATCSVTPGYYWVDDYNQAPFNWAINATATFTPAVGSPFVGSSGNDSTNKITKANGLFQEPFSHFHPNNSHLPVSTSSLTFVTDATDSLGRPLKYHWCTSTGVPCGWSLSPSVTIDLQGGVIIVELAYVCPQGIDEPVSFECNRNVVSIYITKN